MAGDVLCWLLVAAAVAVAVAAGVFWF